MKTVINDKRLFRDPHNAKVSGVCAGLAKYLGVNEWIVRCVTVAAFLVVPFAIALAYVLAVLLLSYK